MSTKSREVIFGSRIAGAKIRAEAAAKAFREADRAEAESMSIRMERYGGPAQPSPTTAQRLSGGYGWLQVRCHQCKTEASIPLEHGGALRALRTQFHSRPVIKICPIAGG
jgi:hypothetical protein